MKNIIDYAKTYTEPFSTTALNEVDSLIFSQLSYLNLDNIRANIDNGNFTIQDLAKSTEPTIYKIRAKENNKKLVENLGNNPRFKDIVIKYYEKINDSNIQMQFCAVTFLWDDFAYIAFRGTDSTLVGWKEDFNATFKDVVPSQTMAVDYIERHLAHLPKYFYIGGHSKGGNMAIYSAVHSAKEVQDRMLIAFDFDGPGVKKENLTEDRYLRIKDKIFTIIPEKSIFGMALYNDNNYLVVQSDGIWFYQHDPFNWHIQNNSFIYLKDVADVSKINREALNRWLYETDPAMRALLVDTIYNIVSATNAEKIGDIKNNPMKNAGIILKAYRNIDKQCLTDINNVVVAFWKFRQEIVEYSNTETMHKTDEIMLQQILSKVGLPLKTLINKLPIDGYKEMLGKNKIVKKAKKVSNKIGDKIGDQFTKIGLFAIDLTEKKQKEVSTELAKIAQTHSTDSQNKITKHRIIKPNRHTAIQKYTIKKL